MAPEPNDPGQVLRHQVVFVLVRPLQSGNVGAVARAMMNMGLRRLVVVAPPALDIDRARWMAPGAAGILDTARYVRTVAEAVADCHTVYATTARSRHDHWPAVETAGFARAVHEAAAGPGEHVSAVLFGAEDSGLANDELVHAHTLLHIPTDLHASLNLGQAALLVAAALHGEARARGYIPRPEGTGRRGGPARGATPSATHGAAPAPVAAQDPVINDWMSALELSNYFLGHERILVEGTLRRMIRRAELTGQELAVLRGMLRKFRWKMQHPTPEET